MIREQHLITTVDQRNCDATDFVYYLGRAKEDQLSADDYLSAAKKTKDLRAKADLFLHADERQRKAEGYGSNALQVLDRYANNVTVLVDFPEDIILPNQWSSPPIKY